MKRILFLLFISFNTLFAFAQQSQAPYEFQTKYHMVDSAELYVPHFPSKSFTSTQPPTGTIRAIAEWEPAQAVLVSYPAGFGIPTELIREMSENCKVITLVESASQQTTVTNLYNSNNVVMANCQFKITQLDSYWTRDYGPWFIMTNNNTVAIIDFPYNRPQRTNDDNVPVFMAGSSNLNMPWYGMNVLHTGGNYMTDGMGVAAMTDLVTDENSLTVAQIDTLFKQYMGITKCYITTDPLNDYIKHVDCWGKFLDVDKILIASVPTSNPQYNAYEAMATYWSTKVSSYGNNYQVFRVYEPNGQPYTNSLILNKKVLIPMNSSYGTTNNNACTAVYQQAMPGYEILGFQQLSLQTAWASTDALHCRAHEIADKGMLYINHYPLLGQKPVQTNYTVNANVYALSGSNLITDSAWVRYRVNHGAWQQALMTHPSGNLWTANIPATPPAGGDTIEYYVHASDLSPRSTTHPLIGAPDPHKFWVAPTTSVKENQSSKIILFPNPAVDYIFIQPEGETNGSISVRIMNSLGAVVCDLQNVKLNNCMLQIPVGDLPCGTYFVQVNAGTSVSTHKVMIMH
jgi:agmatine/peptidylarginine deiminase